MRCSHIKSASQRIERIVTRRSHVNSLSRSFASLRSSRPLNIPFRPDLLPAHLAWVSQSQDEEQRHCKQGKQGQRGLRHCHGSSIDVVKLAGIDGWQGHRVNVDNHVESACLARGGSRLSRQCGSVNDVESEGAGCSRCATGGICGQLGCVGESSVGGADPGGAARGGGGGGKGQICDGILLQTCRPYLHEYV